jgi:hypothetical protein
MWGKLIKGVGTLGTKMMANKGNIAMGVASSGFNAWGGPSGADEEEFQKAMEQLHAEGLMKGEDGSGGPIDPNDMMEFWKKNSWHSQNEGKYWGGQAVSGALGFIPWAGIPLSMGADYLFDKQVDNRVLMNTIRNKALDYKNQSLQDQLNYEEEPQEEESYEEPEEQQLYN